MFLHDWYYHKVIWHDGKTYAVDSYSQQFLGGKCELLNGILSHEHGDMLCGLEKRIIIMVILSAISPEST